MLIESRFYPTKVSPKGQYQTPQLNFEQILLLFGFLSACFTAAFIISIKEPLTSILSWYSPRSFCGFASFLVLTISQRYYHINFWSQLKRGYIGIYDYMSPKHLHRYCDEFATRYSQRDVSNIEIIKNSSADRVRYNELTGE